MGWNKGYTIFEQTVIGAYNLGKLDKDMLTVLMEPYRDTDIDSGGSHDLKTKDGKRVEQIVIETWGLTVPIHPGDESDELDDYYEALYEQFDIVTDHFGWR